LSRVQGQKLQSFFDRWVFNSGHPQYKVSWEWLPAQHDVKITINQTQQSDAFFDPVPISITTSSGTTTTLITPTGKSYVKTVQLKDRPTKIDFDPKSTLLKEVSVEGP
jgi:aminopeptidase N